MSLRGRNSTNTRPTQQGGKSRMIIPDAKKVVIESPYSGDTKKNLAYLNLCMLDSIRRGEAPIASHKLYTDILNDDDPEERSLGINLGFAWLKVADLVAFYSDLGMSRGMSLSLDRLKKRIVRVPYEIRTVDSEIFKTLHWER